MNRSFNQLRGRAVQAAILAALLWLSALAFDWPWLLFGVLATIGYGVACLAYATFLWWLNRR
ncbi:hypothetical protein [Lacticaseibacillus daqingensis]|uniref:hypothetical protein n=1 Tax=Lacticaseibacillus daqingensis TaxID=2486014 RepID=UPI000F7A89F3|nr:hypothetical protein [Lacticaseibacillus daqingensis]